MTQKPGIILYGSDNEELLLNMVDLLEEMDTEGIFKNLIKTCDSIKDFKSDKAQDLIDNEMPEAFDYFSPPYSHFGKLPGTNYDYGYIVDANLLEICFDGLKCFQISVLSGK